MRKVKSIITDDFEHCYLCGRPAECVHHMLPGAKRKASDRLGLVVPLCNDCHTMGPLMRCIPPVALTYLMI